MNHSLRKASHIILLFFVQLQAQPIRRTVQATRPVYHMLKATKSDQQFVHLAITAGQPIVSRPTKASKLVRQVIVDSALWGAAGGCAYVACKAPEKAICIASELHKIIAETVAHEELDHLHAGRLAAQFVDTGEPVTLEKNAEISVLNDRLEEFLYHALFRGEKAKTLNKFLKQHPEITNKSDRFHMVFSLSDYPDAPEELKGYILKTKRPLLNNIGHQLSRVIVAYAMNYLNREKKLKHIVFPQKWIHLAPHGNRIIVAQKLDLVSPEENIRAWKHITQEQINEIVYVIYELGFSDVQTNNIWFTKEGKIAFIDNDVSAISNANPTTGRNKKSLGESGRSALCHLVARSNELKKFCDQCKSKNNTLIYKEFLQTKARLEKNERKPKNRLVEQITQFLRKKNYSNSLLLEQWDKGTEQSTSSHN